MNLWEVSKAKSAQEGKPNDWVNIIQIYKQLGGMEKSLIILIDNKDYEVLGKSNTGLPLVQDKETKSILEISDNEYTSGKKMFKSTGIKDLSKLIKVQKVVVKKDGTSYLGTFYVSPQEAKELKNKQEITEEEYEEKTQNKEDSYWRNKTAELQADISAMWYLQSRNLYSSTNLGALAVREGIQNARDAIVQAKKVKQITEGRIDINLDGSSVIIKDNGIGMDVKTLHTKFLNLGGTTKGGGSGEVGGFGVAKAVILGCGESFEIKTRDNYLNSKELGSGKIAQSKPIQGTEITVHNVETGKNWSDDTPIILNKDTHRRFVGNIKEYLSTSDFGKDIEVFIGNKKIESKFKLGPDTYKIPAFFGISNSLIPPETDISINVVNKPEDDYSSAYIYVRLGGLTQYKVYIGGTAKVDVVLDFTTKLDPRSEKYPFTSSREALKSAYSGIVDAITDTLNSNPMAVESNSIYKETMFENVSEKIKQERAIIASFSAKEVKDAIAKFSDIIAYHSDASTDQEKDEGAEVDGYPEEGIVAQGERKLVSFADLATQSKRQLQLAAEKYGMTEEEVLESRKKQIKNAEVESDNPLEYSWLVWEDKNRKNNFDISKNVDVLVAWDSILRLVANSYVKSEKTNGFPTFYPGFILEDGTYGMSVKKPIPQRHELRSFIMVNPEMLRTDSDAILAGHLRGLACHELAHALCGSFENHGETHSYTREALDLRSLDILEDLVTVVKQTKLRSKVNKIKKAKEKIEKEKNIAKKFEYKTWDIERSEKKFEKLNNNQSVKEMLYWNLLKLENNPNYYFGKLKENTRVLYVSSDNLQKYGNYYTIESINADGTKATVVPTYDKGGPEVIPVSKLFAESDLIQLRSSLEEHFPQDTEIDDWISDSSILWAVGKYLPAYRMKKMKSMSLPNRLKSLENTITELVNEGYNSATAENKKPEIYSYVSGAVSRLMKQTDYDFYSSTWLNNYSDWDRFINPIIEKRVKGVTNKKRKRASSNKKSKQKSIELTPEQKKLNNKLKNMQTGEIATYASSIQVDADALRQKYPNDGIYRMRLIMAIKSKFKEKDVVVKLKEGEV